MLGYVKNSLGSIIYSKNIIKVLHNHKKTYREHNTLVRILCKQYGFNYFSLGYWKGIAYA
jgi:hypothetical protein